MPVSVPPPQYHPDNHSFTLQTMLEIQKSVGALTEATNSLKSGMDSMQCKLDDTKGSVKQVQFVVYAASAIAAILIVIGGWTINKVWEVGYDMYKSNAANSSTPPLKQ